MEIEERVKSLEDGFQVEKDSLKQVLLDIRVHLMETRSPLKSRSELRNAIQQQKAQEGGR